MVLNPFDLPGPQFLLFYLVFAGVVIGGAILLIRHWDMPNNDTASEQELMNDPYAIAYIVGGQMRMIRVIVLSLVDRGLLEAEEDGRRMCTLGGLQAVAIARRPLEKAVLQRAMHPCAMADLYTDTNVRLAAELIESRLQRSGFLPSPEAASLRARVLRVGSLLLIGVSAVKIVIALAREHHNFMFLIMLTLVAFFVLGLVCREPIVTRAGATLTRRLAERFAFLRLRTHLMGLGSGTADLAYLAAVFGAAALPAAVVAALPRDVDVSILTRRSGTGGSNCGSSSCGGGSSCSSGGSGCGGGGGCGGCGGGD